MRRMNADGEQPADTIPPAPSRAPAKLVLAFRIAALIALLLFSPLVLCYLYHKYFAGNFVLAFLRGGLGSIFFLFFFMFLAAWVGGRWGWLTAPGVQFLSGLLSAIVEAGMAKEPLGKTMSTVLVLTLVVALPMGAVVSYYFTQRERQQQAESSAPTDDAGTPS